MDISFNHRLMQMIADGKSVMIGEVIERGHKTDAIIGAAMEVATNVRAASWRCGCCFENGRG